MPSRSFVAGEMAELLGVLAHPHRIRIVEELRNADPVRMRQHTQKFRHLPCDK